MDGLTTTIIEVYYQIEWLVPKEQAIGGVSFWHTIVDGHYHADEKMMELFDVAKKEHDTGTIRLIQIQKRLVNRE